MNLHHTGFSVAGRPCRQTGLSNMLLTLLISLSLTTVALGAMYATRGAQSGEMALHAQTLAEIKAMTGVQALTSFLNTQSSGTIANIASGSITVGTQTTASYSQSATCPGGSNYYCYDVTGSSGGASAIVRARYLMQSTPPSISGSSTVGSVFAGGLSMNGKSSLVGHNNPTVEVGNGYKTGDPIAGVSGVTLETYTPTAFIQPSDVRQQANYIYRSDGTCWVNNLAMNDSTGKTSFTITSETSCSDSRLNSAGITIKPVLANTSTITYTAPSGSTLAQWTVYIKGKTNTYAQLPAGVLWFDGDVDVVPEDSSAIQINTIVATGSIISEPVKQSYMYAYAPSYYPKFYAQATDLSSKNLNLSDTPEHTCNNAANVLYPTQICTNGSFNTLTTWPGMVANILFLAANNLTLGGGTGNSLATTNYYGDLMSSTGSGGTGNASGKFTGNGTIDITGNIVNAGSATQATFSGNITMNLTGTNGNVDYVPIVNPGTYSFTLNSMTYL